VEPLYGERGASLAAAGAIFGVDLSPGRPDAGSPPPSGRASGHSGSVEILLHGASHQRFVLTDRKFVHVREP